MRALRSGLLALLLVLGAALGAMWLSGAAPPAAVPRLVFLPPDATVRAELHNFVPYPTMDSVPVAHIGTGSIQQGTSSADGIYFGFGDVLFPAMQFARFEHQMITVTQSSYVWLYGPLDGNLIVQREDGEFVLHLEEQLLLRLRQMNDDLRTIRVAVTELQAGALLDRSTQQLTIAVNSAAWRDHARLQPASGVEVFVALQNAQAALQTVMDDRRLLNSLEHAEDGQRTIYMTVPGLIHTAQGLAHAAIEEAQEAGAPQEALAEAQAEEDAGWSDDFWHGLHAEAMQHYLAAWLLAVQAMPTP